MNNTYKKIISPLYVINILIQAIISLISPIAIMFLFAWLLVKYASAGTWIYVVFILLGVFCGLYSMVIFILRASRALDAIDKATKTERGGSNTKK